MPPPSPNRYPVLASQAPKICDEIVKLQAAGETFISFEYYPPRTEEGVKALINRMGRMKLQEPLYADVTWGAGGSTSDLTFDLVKIMTETHGLTANMHLSAFVWWFSAHMPSAHIRGPASPVFLSSIMCSSLPACLPGGGVCV